MCVDPIQTMPKNKAAKAQNKPQPAPAKGKAKASGPKRRNRNKSRADMQTISAPYAAGSVFRPITNASEIRPSKNGGIIIPRTTLLGTVAGIASGAFDCHYYTINPGLPNGRDSLNLSPFSWIQGAANLYDRYRVRKMSIEFVTSTNPTVSTGDVMMMFDYDVSDTTPTTEAGFLNSMGAVLGPVWSQKLQAFAKPKLASPINGYKVRSGAIPTGGITTDYDMATLYIATVGTTNTSVVGRLFLHYEIEFFLPTA